MPGSVGPTPMEPCSLLAQQSEIKLQDGSKARGGVSVIAEVWLDKQRPGSSNWVEPTTTQGGLPASVDSNSGDRA